MEGDARTAWEAVYKGGRYLEEPPVPFVSEILSCARDAGLLDSEGLYIGCGNGRNYLPLVAGGIDLIGLDISETALEQLAARAPERRGRLVHGDLSSLPPGERYRLVIGIQVFQHGDAEAAHAHIQAAQRLMAPGGLFCVRVNAVGTDIALEHEIIEEEEAGGGFTVRYLAGSKKGLAIHFFGLDELTALFGEDYDLVLGPRLDRTWRPSPEPGQWSQWEGIWRRRGGE